MNSDETSPDGKWTIQWHCTKDFHAFFESDTRYEARLIHIPTGKVVERWSRDEYENSNGEDISGIRSATFSPDSTSVTVSFEDGTTETIPLTCVGDDGSSAGV